MSKEIKSINILKGIACLAVVLNHFHGPGTAGDIVSVLSNFGVPIFFLISGYFLYNGESTLEKIPRKINHVTQLLLLHIGMYIIDFITERIFLMGNLVRKDVVVNDILSYFTINSLQASLFWSKSLFGTGQWFIIALLEGYVICFYLYKTHLSRIIEDYGAWIACILFFVHIPVRIILLANGITEVFGQNISENAIVRNVWFDGLPFMFLGIWLRKYGVCEKWKSDWLPLVSIVALILSIGEFYLTGKILKQISLRPVLYFGTIISVISAFIWAIRNHNGSNNTISNGFEYLGKNLSMIVFFIHLIVGTYLAKLGGNISSKTIFPLICLIGSVCVSYIVYKIQLIIGKSQNFNLVYTFLLVICISILILPVGTEWRMLCKYTGRNEQVVINEYLGTNYQSTILITAQNNRDITVDAVEIPVQQFIGGGVKRSAYNEDNRYSYDVSYIDNNSVKIRMSESLRQIRIWAR